MTDPHLRLESTNPFYLTLDKKFDLGNALGDLPKIDRLVIPQWVFDFFAKSVGHPIPPLVEKIRTPWDVVIQRETFLPRDLGAGYLGHSFKFWVKFDGEGKE